MKTLVLISTFLLALGPTLAEHARVTELSRDAASDLQKARETGLPEFAKKAERSLREALEVSPGDYSALLLLGHSLLSQHRFNEALETGRRLVNMRSADPMSHGILGDAAVELGQYEVAAKEYQTMIELKPNFASYSRAAHIRELHGDFQGALQLMKMSVDSAGAGPRETLAWCLFQIGLLHFKTGNLQEAERHFGYSLEVFPDYYLACEHLAELRVYQGKYDEAIRMYEQVIAQNPEPEYYDTLASIYARKGDRASSRKFEKMCEKLYLESIRNGNAESYRGLARFYLSRDWKLKNALSFALKDAAVRPTVYAYDTLAWAYYKNGEYEKANEMIQKALRLGTKDATFYYHAGLISLARGQKPKGEEFLSKAREINPLVEEMS